MERLKWGARMVKHVLKDGTVLDDISGIVITREQFPEVYKILGKYKGENENEKLESESIS